MTTSECTRAVQWKLVIERGADDDAWPEKMLIKGLKTRYIRPDKIVLVLHGGDRLATSVLIVGDRWKPALGADLRAVSRHQLDRNVPEWAQILIDKARRYHGCGPGAVTAGYDQTHAE